MVAKFKVRQDLMQWGSDAGVFKPGQEHEVSGSEDIMQQIADAFAAGSLVDVSFDEDAPRVESDAESLQKLNKAMSDGTWLEGHLAQFEIDKETAALNVEVGGNIEIGGAE